MAPSSAKIATRTGSKTPGASAGGGLHPFKMKPRTEGPRITPMAISPMMVGWRSRLMTKWLATATVRRMVSCRKSSSWERAMTPQICGPPFKAKGYALGPFAPVTPTRMRG